MSGVLALRIIMFDPKVLRYDRVHGLVANERDIVTRSRFVDTTGRIHSIAGGNEIKIKEILDGQAARDNVRVQDNAQEKMLVIEFPEPMKRSTRDGTGPKFHVHIVRMELEYNPNSVPERFVNVVPMRRTRSGREFA